MLRLILKLCFKGYADLMENKQTNKQTNNTTEQKSKKEGTSITPVRKNLIIPGKKRPSRDFQFFIR